MGIETFVLIRQEAGWGREERWMWRRRRRVTKRTRKAHLLAAQIYKFLYFCYCSFIVFWQRTCQKLLIPYTLGT